MKKYTLSLMLCLAVIASAFAQSKNVRKAQSALDKGELGEAKTMIDQAITDEKTKDDGKTWFIYGNVYQAIATDSTNTAPQVENPFEKALEGYKKAKSLEKEGSNYYTMSEQMIQQVWGNSINMGATHYQNQEYDQAMKMFDVAKMAVPEDTTGYIYAGISAQQAGDMEQAAQNYEYLLDSLDYKSQDFYNSLIYIYTNNEETKNTDKAVEYLRKAQKAFPENGDYLTTEVNLLLTEENYEEAETKLQQAIQNDPDNAMLLYNQGYMYEQVGQGEKAIESYEKAIELDPQYYDATFNLGAYHYNQAAEVLQQANNMDLKEYQEKGQAIEDSANVYFEKALPFLEKARELKPEDEKVLTTLQTVYTRLGMEDKAQEIQAKLNGSGK